MCPAAAAATADCHLLLPPVVPEGFFISSPGQVAPCPRGEYKAGFGLVSSCSKCVEGVTTDREASASAAACTVVLPTYYPAEVTNGVVTAAHACPQKYVCPGGNVTAAFNTSTPDVVTGTTMLKCPDGAWTQTTGASGLNQCSKSLLLLGVCCRAIVGPCLPNNGWLNPLKTSHIRSDCLAMTATLDAMQQASALM
jgi:hypothetical protein